MLVSFEFNLWSSLLVPDYVSTRDQQVNFLDVKFGTVRGSTCLLHLVSGSAEGCDHSWIVKASSHIARRDRAALCSGLEKSLSERHGRSTAWARHGHGMENVNQTRPHCLNQMGNTQSKHLAARHAREMAWALQAMCELTSTGGSLICVCVCVCVRACVCVFVCVCVFFSHTA